MIAAIVGEPFEAVLTGAPEDQVGVLTVEIYDPTDGAAIMAPRSTGITEPRPGTYVTSATVATAGDYMVRWALGSSVGEEQLVVTTAVVVTVPAELRPTVDEVALLLRTRTVGGIATTGLGADTGPDDVGTFTTETRPTAVEVERVIDHALDEILAQLAAPGEEHYGGVRRAIALRAAAIIEQSFFRESPADSDLVTALATELRALQAIIPRGAVIASGLSDREQAALDWWAIA